MAQNHIFGWNERFREVTIRIKCFFCAKNYFSLEKNQKSQWCHHFQQFFLNRNNESKNDQFSFGMNKETAMKKGLKIECKIIVSAAH